MSTKFTVSAIIILGICSLTIIAVADTTYNPNFTVPEIHGGGSGSNTSSSFAAASLMGEKGYTNTYLGVVQPLPPLDWQAQITAACTTKTTPSSVWPSTCNPDGMATALNSLIASHGGFADWVVYTSPGTANGLTAALNETVISLAVFHSPGVVPIFGQADHWVTISQIVANPVSPGVYNIVTVKGFDGGPTGGTDSNNSTFNGGPQSWSAFVWKQVFYLVVTAINKNCDFQPGGCGAAPYFDPYYGRYVLMFEPPAGPLPQLSANFERSPGVVPPGHMNEQLAQVHLWNALIAAGIDKDPDIWNTISHGVAGSASLVNGRFPDGSPWNYYLVPILPDRFANTAIALVELSADDGSFNHIQVPSNPVPFTPVSRTRAAQVASSVLARGESLTGGTLTWDPMTHARSPSFPYYEFGIVGANDTSSVARVMLHDGAITRGR